MLDFISIRAASVQDVALLSYLSTVTFYELYEHEMSSSILFEYTETYFSERKIRDEINTEASRYFIAAVNEKPVGYFKIGKTIRPIKLEYPDYLEIERLYVLEEYLGQGVTSRLLDYCEELAKNEGNKLLWLSIWKKNTKAIAYFNSSGYKIFDTVKFYLIDQVLDDVLLKKVLD